jgi:hypothetical protein
VTDCRQIELSDVVVMINDNTAVLYADPVVMNNTTTGFATGGDP